MLKQSEAIRGTAVCLRGDGEFRIWSIDRDAQAAKLVTKWEWDDEDFDASVIQKRPGEKFSDLELV